MKQSTSNHIHAAVIMDGNGRWAARRGLPRIAGHRAGADALRRAIEAAPELGIDILTVYAFSSDNWKRPRDEVSCLMRLFRDYLANEAAECARKGIRIQVIGRRDRFPAWLVPEIQKAEAATRTCSTLTLRIAADYSSQDAILRAATRLRRNSPTRENFARLVSLACNGGGEARDVDLLIRTGGEQRLSDFLLWESAYAELYFTPVMWPDFSRSDLAAAVASFRSRERRFGALPEAAAG